MSRTVVIGAGVIGLACAYELRRRGDEVIVLDRIGPGAAASAGNTGWIVPSFSGPVPAPGLVGQSVRWMLSSDSPLYVKPRLDPGFLLWLWAFWKYCTKSAYEAGLDAVAALNTQTMALYDALAADGVRFEMHCQGVLFAFLGRAALEHVGADLERMRRYGYEPAETLTAHEVRDLEPLLSANVIGGIVAGRERHVRPESLVAGFVERLSALGVDLRGGTEVTGFRRRGPMSTSDRRAAGGIGAVETSTGAIDTDRVVVAAGAWSGQLVRHLGFRLPLQAGKGYSITLEQPDAQLGRPLYLDEARVAVSNFDGALRLAGTMELSGLNAGLNARRVGAIRRSADRYLVGWRRALGERVWVGMRPLTPDGLPVIGAVPGADNVYLATGHGMLGVTLAPATAVALAELMVTGRRSAALSPFDPARFLPRRSSGRVPPRGDPRVRSSAVPDRREAPSGGRWMSQ